MNRYFLQQLTTLFVGLLLFTLHSCGLKYVAPPTNEDLENTRRTAIEESYSQTFISRNKQYKPLTYGELIVVKPNSYRRLDSLYTRKYALAQIGSSDEALEQRIEVQKMNALNDTNPIIYVENHWYELQNDSTSEFVIDEIRLTKENKIISVEQLNYFEVTKEWRVWARKYMIEDYFVSFYAAASDQEIDFYTAYKEMASTMEGREKQFFIDHTLKIMQLANKNTTLSAEILLKKLTEQALSTANPGINLSGFTYTVERIMQVQDGLDDFLYYKVSVLSATMEVPLVFKYDYYLRVVQ